MRLSRIAIGVLVPLLLLLAAACATRGPGPSSPTHAAPVQVLQGSRLCGGCHAAAEEGWRASLHHTSFSDRDFQRALADDPLPFCADCHAPRRRDLGATTAASSLGVDCASCHTNATTHEREALAGFPRTTTASVMKTVTCESCHELPNPVAATMLQTTATEHASSSTYAGVSCIDCHMPRHDHEMSVTRNANLLSNALAYTVNKRSSNNNELVIALRSKGVGHRFPTGDLFRTLRIHCWIESPDGRIVSETKTSLHRDWDSVRRIPGTTPTPDTRLTDDAPVEITLPASPSTTGGTLHIQVDYARGATARGDNFTMFSTLRIADWTVPLH